MKIKKLIALAVAVLTITMAFAPAALATGYAPTYWSQWPTQAYGSNETTYIFALQNVIKGHYYLSNPSGFTVDGSYGTKTRNKVTDFQSDNDVNVTSSNVGVVDTLTWIKMRSFLTGERHTVYDELLDKYTTYYGVYNHAKTSSSSDWFRNIHMAGSSVINWATNRDGSRSTWHNIQN